MVELRYLMQHPHRNPAHRPFGRERRTVYDPVTKTEHTIRGPRNPSRWLPHQGVAECARRRRQMEKRHAG